MRVKLFPLEFEPVRLLLADMIRSAYRFWKILVLVVMLAFATTEVSSRNFAIDYGDLTPAALKAAMNQNVKGYKTGIALSGGGARGFAHLGVLEELEKSGVEIDIVAGTSMGGIIGGLYAAGMSPEQIETTALSIRWSDFFSDKPQRGSQLFTRRAETEGELLTLRFDGFNPKIPTALSSGQQLVNVLSSLTLTSSYFSKGDFANLDRKLAVVATDIVTGEKVVFERGSMIEALRATMGVPLAFTPLEQDGRLLMDGGLLEPIPTRTVRKMGADFVIAVDVTSDFLPIGEISDAIDIAGQVTTILSAEAKRLLLSEADFVVTPDLLGFKATAFDLGDSAIARGRRAMAPRIMELKRQLAQVTDTCWVIHLDSVTFEGTMPELASSFERSARGNLTRLQGQSVRVAQINQAAYELFRTGAYASVSFRFDGNMLVVETTPFALINQISINGNQLYADSTLLRVSGFDTASVTSTVRLQEVYNNILNYYRRNGYDLAKIKSASLDTSGGKLEIHLDEGRISGISVEGNDQTRWWVVTSYFPLDAGDFYSKFRAMRGVQDIHGSGLFDNVNLRLEERNGGVWITIIVKERSFTFASVAARYHEDFHPESVLKMGYANLFGTGNELSLGARFSERRKLYQLQLRADRIFRTFMTYNIRFYYTNDKIGQFQDGKRISDRTDKRWGIKFGVGQQLWKRGLFDITARFEGIRSQLPDKKSSTERRVASLQSGITVDTRDRFTFPTTGRVLKGTLEIASDVLSADEVFRRFEGSAEGYVKLTRWLNVHPSLALGLSENALPIYDKFYLGGSRSFSGYSVDQLVGDKYLLSNFEVRLGPVYGVYLSFRYDAGQVFGRFEEVRPKGLRHSWGAALALDTPLGPFSIGYGRAEAKYDRLYLNLGFDF
jgi:NTE family protein